MSQTAQFPAESSKEGIFVRQAYTIRDRFTADGIGGFRAEPGRYHLYVSLACPWAHRTLIFRKLKSLENVISVSVVDPFMGEMGWAFSAPDGSISPGSTQDEVRGVEFLYEIYAK